MTPSAQFLLERVASRPDQPNPFTDAAPCSMEQALLRARIALDAGWQLTPDEILAFTGQKEAPPQSSFLQTMAVETEDEIDDIPDYFSADA